MLGAGLTFIALLSSLRPGDSAPAASASANAEKPKRYDPCGGPQELLKKYLAASPCVFVIGQASVQAIYASTNIPANTQLNVGGAPAGVATYRHAFSYPAPLVNIGVARNAQIILALPSFSQIRSSTLGTLAAGATDMEFSYKQLVYVDNGVLGGVLFSYEAPTGSAGLASPGPAYEFNPLLSITVNRSRTLAISLAFPVSNFAISSSESSAAQRGWSFAPQAVPLWRSPGGTLLAVVLRHDFASHVSSLTINTAQLLTRQVQLQATYGGVNTTFDYTNPVNGIVRASSSSYPRSFTMGFSYLMGLSDLPPSK